MNSVFWQLAAFHSFVLCFHPHHRNLPAIRKKKVISAGLALGGGGGGGGLFFKLTDSLVHACCLCMLVWLRAQ